MNSAQVIWTEKRLAEILDQMAKVLIENSEIVLTTSKTNSEVAAVLTDCLELFDEYGRQCKQKIKDTYKEE